MKKKIFILGTIFGLLIGITTTVYAVYKYNASEIGYTPSNASFKVDNVSDAIKELYEKYENGSSNIGILGNIEKSDNYLPTGYFKSKSDDNNVIFGGYCWKIIRKNGDDDIRMIYNGLPHDGECNRTGEDTQIDTSKYSDDSTVTNYADSKVKEVVDNWYNTNLSTYEDKITNIDLITREEATNVSGGYLVSGQQYWTQTPEGGSVTTTSSCSISYSAGSNKGNCSATPSGDISSSTIYIVDSEGKITSNNNGTYSGNVPGSCSYCTMWQKKYSGGTCGGDGATPSCSASSNNGCSCCSYSTYNGSCTATASGSSLGVRPVITLKNTVTLQGGEGTTTNPYYLN